MKQHLSALKGIQEEFHQFCLYQDRLQHNKGTYMTISSKEKKLIAERILKDDSYLELIATDLTAKIGLDIEDILA